MYDKVEQSKSSALRRRDVTAHTRTTTPLHRSTLQLQRAAGNGAVSALLGSTKVQWDWLDYLGSPGPNGPYGGLLGPAVGSDPAGGWSPPAGSLGAEPQTSVLNAVGGDPTPSQPPNVANDDDNDDD